MNKLSKAQRVQMIAALVEGNAINAIVRMYAVALHFMHYNFCRVHETLRCTPAMAAGVAKRIWKIEDIVNLLG